MSNIFKKNSRFSVLCEDIELNHNNNNNNNNKNQKTTKENNRFNINDTEPTAKINNFKAPPPQESRDIHENRNRYDDRVRYDRNRTNKFNYDPEKERLKAEKMKEEQVKESLSINSFPVLIETNKNTNQGVEPSKPSFLEKINTKKNEVIEVIEEEKIEPGWVKITYNKKTKKIDYKYGAPVSSSKEKKPTELIVLQRLAQNYETWKANYIQLWGEDEYEKMYRFPNYDYQYFDKLDEEYERLQEEYEMENNKEDSDCYD
jgi:hypothetical protein